MYKADGPEALRSSGETEFVNGIAAMSASGLYGTTRIAAGIVGTAISVSAMPSAPCSTRRSPPAAAGFAASASRGVGCR